MTPQQEFVLHPLAAQDITEIWEYIAADNPTAASRVRQEIHDRLRSLARFPLQDVRRPDLTWRPLRFTHLREYLVVYAPDERPLWMIAVIHARRSPRVIAAILRSREDTA